MLHSAHKQKTRTNLLYISITALLIAVSFIGTSYAQSSDDYIAAPAATADDINLRLGVELCDGSQNQERYEYITASPGTSTTLCFDVTNNYTFPVTSKFYIEGGGINNQGRISCGNVNSPIAERFDNYTKELTIAALDTARLEFDGTFTIDDIGEIAACLIHEINQDQDSEGGLAVRLRNSLRFFLFVTGEIEVNTKIIPEIPHAHMIQQGTSIGVGTQDQVYVIGAQFSNQGGLVHQVQATGFVTDILGNQYDFPAIQRQVAPGNTDTLAFIMEELPRYKLRFTADVTITHQAQYGRIDPSFLNDDITREHTYQETITFFVMPRWLIIGLVALILLIIIIKKIRHAQHAKAAAMQAELEELRQLKAAKDAEKSVTDSPSEPAPQ